MKQAWVVGLVAAMAVTACGGNGGGEEPDAGSSDRATVAGSPVASSGTTVVGSSAGETCLGPTTNSEFDATFLQVLREDFESVGTSPGSYMAVRVPSRGIAYAGGIAPDGATLEPRAPFRIASNTKTFTAAAILRLQELGTLSIDDGIDEHISEETRTLLLADSYDPEAISIRDALHHVSGLYDYATDDAYTPDVLADPNKRWTRPEQIAYAMSHGDPIGEPGEQYEYSDTGYVILGEIIERSTGQTLAAAYRSLLKFDELGLRDTYLETLESVPAGTPDRIPQLFGEVEASGVDPSYDLYGGGGLVSTVDDLSRFYCALFSGELFDDPASTATMISPPERIDEGIAMGLFGYKINGEQCWGHNGFWWNESIHCPDSGTTVVRTINQALPPDSHDFDALPQAILAALE